MKRRLGSGRISPSAGFEPRPHDPKSGALTAQPRGRFRNQAAAAYLSLYLIFFFPILNPKKFCHTFLRNFEVYIVETLYTW